MDFLAFLASREAVEFYAGFICGLIVGFCLVFVFLKNLVASLKSIMQEIRLERESLAKYKKDLREYEAILEATEAQKEAFGNKN
ncbi:hypothetical protein [Helicobacter sp. T3_23-1056]